MLKNHIAENIKNNLGFRPTKSQNLLIEKLAGFIQEIDKKEIFILNGYAGTGKTAVLAALVRSFRTFKIKSVLLAPTGRAAKVVTSRSGKNAFTIHKKIFRQKSGKEGFGEFKLDKNLHKNTIFIVDEASMIGNESVEKSSFGSGRLLDDLIDFVFEGENCKLLLMGDTAQLPPVKLNLSPALDTSHLKTYHYPLMQFTLTEVVRQAETSGILHNSILIREKIDLPKTVPFIEWLKFSDIIPLSGNALLEGLEWSYDKYGIHESIVICRSNKRANKFNLGIRQSILYREERLTVGDRLMVVRNNYFWMKEYPDIEFIANGEIVEVTAIRGYETLYDMEFANVSVKLTEHESIDIEVKILLNTLETETASMTTEQGRDFFKKVAEDYSEESEKKTQIRKVLEDPYFNALQVKYAYAITCHKAQGGQWKSVFIDIGYLPNDSLNSEFFRWLYTAFTRATERLYLINFPQFLMKDNVEFD